MNIIVDVIAVAIIVISAIIAAKKGFVRSLIELAGYILALIIAVNFAGWFANIVYDNYISSDVVEVLSGILYSGSENIINDLPASFVAFADMANIDFTILSGESSFEAAERIVEAIRPVAVGVIKSVIMVVVAIILIIVFKLLARIINSLFRGAILGSVNGGLGALIGGAKGVIYATLACVLVSFLITTTGGSLFGITVETLQNTTVCKFLLSLVSFAF